jgi:hypothetical protein
VNQHMRRAQPPHSAASIRPTSECAIRGDHVANSPLDWAHPNPGLAHTTLGWLHAPTMGHRHAANHRLHGVARSSRATEAQDSPIRRELCVYSAAWVGRCRRHHRQHASTPCVWQPRARARCIRPLQTELRSRSVQIASKAARWNRASSPHALRALPGDGRAAASGRRTSHRMKSQGLKIQGLKIQGLKSQGLPASAQPTRCSRVNAPCPADRAMLDEATPTRAAWMPTPHQALHQVSTATLLR